MLGGHGVLWVPGIGDLGCQSGTQPYPRVLQGRPFLLVIALLLPALATCGGGRPQMFDSVRIHPGETLLYMFSLLG